MEKLVEQGLLFDFYGELLNEHQKEVYGLLVNNDFSISEIAEEYGISRQAASDLIKRIDKILFSYESKLKLVERFEKIRNIITETSEIPENIREKILSEL